MPNKLGWMGSEEERVMSRIIKTESGCWEWTGHTVKGYARFKTEGSRKTVGVHRWAYEHFVGPIPHGLKLDHLCRNTKCINPKHLEPVTNRENTLRGDSPSAILFRKDQCAKGHPLSGDNVRISSSNGQRVCKTCMRIYSKKSKDAKRSKN